MASPLVSRTRTPIAQLNPELPNQAERVVGGEVTITWPYNSVTKTTAFLLAESDILLRRAKGQVRIELHGPSAKEFSSSGIGAGDEVLFSLEGAEWAKDESPGRVPGARLDWQLLFNQRLTLQAKLSDSNEPKLIDIDHPQPEPEPAPAPVQDPMLVEPEVPVPQVTPLVRKISDFVSNEYPSPAFMKRARMSYGSLFEGGMDIFEEDGGIVGKGRKRSRFGRDSSAWRYSSKSPSPAPETPAHVSAREDSVAESRPEPSPKSQMTDEGCQTTEFDLTPSYPALAEPAVESVGGPFVETATSEHPPSPRPDQSAPVVIPTDNSTATEVATEVQRPSPEADDNVRAAAASSLFAFSKQANAGLSMFGTAPPVPVDRHVRMTEQVRFGFSQFPETTQSPVAQQNQVQPVVGDQHTSSGPAKFADMESYVDAAEEEMETAEDHALSSPPPAIKDLNRGGWEFHTEPSDYNNTQGGHYDANALIDGSIVGVAEESQLHSDSMQPEMVPDGFHSYGTQGRSPHIVDVDDSYNAAVAYAENDPRHGQEVEAEDEDGEEDGEYDEGDYEIEEGDYDQRNYNVPADDDEGLSEEQDEIEQETAERYGEGDVYSEDEERDYDEDSYAEGDLEENGFGSEDYEESEGDYEDEEAYYRRSPGAVVTAAPSKPVVISLLSDSEDEDEPPAPPPKKATPDAPAPEESRQGDAAAAVEDEAMSRFQAAEPASPIAQGDKTANHAEQPDAENSEDQMQTDRDPVQLDETSHETPLSHDSAVEFRETNGKLTSQSPDENGIEEVESVVELDKEDEAEGDEVDEGDESAKREEQDGEVQVEEAGDDEEEVVEVEEAEDSRLEELVEAEYILEPEEVEEEELAEEEEDEDEVVKGTSDEEEEEVVQGPGDKDELISLSDDSESEPESGAEMDNGELPFIHGALASPDLGNDFPPSEDAEQDDKENMAPEAPKDGSEAAEEIVAESEQATTTVSEIEIIEVDDSDEDSDAGHPISVSEADGVRTPMDLEEVAADAAVDDEISMVVEEYSETAQIDSEMKEGSAEPDKDNGSVMEVEQSDHENVTLVSGDATNEDAVMVDAPSDTDIVVELHSGLEGGESKDDYMQVDDTDLMRNDQETSETSLKGDLSVDEEPPKASEKITNDSAAAEHPTMGPSTPPLTQQADIDSLDMDNPPHTPMAASTVISNKNQRPLPPLTPTQSFVTTQTVTQVSVTEEHVGPHMSSQVTLTEATHISASFAETTREEDDISLADFSGISKRRTESVEIEETHEETQETSLENEVQETLSAPARSSSPPKPDENLVEPEKSGIEADEPVEEEKSAVAETSFTSPVTRSQTKRSAQTPKPSESGSFQEGFIETSPYSQDATQQLQEEMEAASHRKSPSPDISISLARQSVAAKRSKKGDVDPPQPLRSSPRVLRARSRSNSVQMSVASEVEEDPGVSMARAAAASPSRQNADDEPETAAPPTLDTAALKSELTKGLRKLPECVSLRNMKNHVDKQPNIVGIVASVPTTPLRAKGGPREYMMSFDITDPTIAPLHVVEVQLYRPHKESLPIVKPGDAILLRQLQIKALSKKGFGLRSTAESAWAVFEEAFSPEDGPGAGADGEELPPQIKGPPVEDYKDYSGYMTTLKAWYRSLDDVARGKLEKAVKKFEELGVGTGSGSQK